MTALINIHPFPLFITVDEMWKSEAWGGFHTTLEMRDETLVPVTEFAESTDIHYLSENVRLDGDVQTDGLITANGLLIWEYSAAQREVILRLATAYGVRAVDAAALVAHKIFPELGVLDSDGNRVTKAGKLPKFDGPSQASFHGEHGFPFSVSAPAWFPKRGMPKSIVFSRR
ncbi:hypothetical protein [Microbacterium sp. Leaf320]|uniref:hypothetical protein n=1 Tax=Microbacterium sp. Leaf320 TaxID=1736334 RepID=UPI0006FFCFB1|nr:hypothetical protein [Microbacterium sp. Leaf320]KQQ65413.1 hypothetical protein ASF63_15875 [Microbacterium sp. Leaf320]